MSELDSIEEARYLGLHGGKGRRLFEKITDISEDQNSWGAVVKPVLHWRLGQVNRTSLSTTNTSGKSWMEKLLKQKPKSLTKK